MKKTILYFLFLLTWSTYAQQSPGTPESFDLNLNTDVNSLSFIHKIGDVPEPKDSVYDIGVVQNVSIDLLNPINLIHQSSEVRIYQLKIDVVNVFGIGLIFNDFYIPNNGKLYIYNEDKSIVLGAFSASNNGPSRKLVIPSLPGETIIVEYNEYGTETLHSFLNISKLIKVYRPIFQSENKNVSCYIGVHCVSDIEVDRSVVRITYIKDGLLYSCSGTLINQNVPTDDLKPYVLTADHALDDVDLSTTIFQFNYQQKACNFPTFYTLYYFMQGCSMVAKRSQYDMYLVELTAFPPSGFNVHLAGWSRSNKSNLTNDLMSIHHPESLEKTVSLGTFQANTSLNYWRVYWDQLSSPAYYGSSGSGLFETNNNRLIGWDSNGQGSCADPEAIERYGKFKKAWTGPSSNKRLQDWLDPNFLHNVVINGTDPCFTNLIIENQLLFSAEKTYQPENSVTIQAGNTLVTNSIVTIKEHSEYKFTAGQSLTLNPGFSTENGSDFLATIEPCTAIAKNYEYDIETTIDSNQELNFSELIEINSLNINIYPNPTNGVTSVNYKLLNTENITMQVYSTDGVLLKTIMASQYHGEGIYELSLDLTELNAGIYIFVFNTQNNNFNKKIIIV